MLYVRKFYTALLFISTLSVLGIVIWKTGNAPRTDDAYVYADTINVVPEISGRIIALPAEDNQLVKKGDLLYRIDPRPYQNERDVAAAKLATLEAQIKLTQRSVNAQEHNAQAVADQVESARVQFIRARDSYDRKVALVKKGYISGEEIDSARMLKNSSEAAWRAAQSQARQARSAISGTDALEAQRREILAQIKRAELNLQYTEVRAPFDGRVTALKTTAGQYASPAQPVMTLIDTRHWFVEANLRETDLADIHKGTPVKIFIMSDTGKSFRGVVDSVSFGVQPTDGGTITGGLPAVSRSINWVHVSQRFPVKIRVDKPDPDLFRIGASAVVILYRG